MAEITIKSVEGNPLNINVVMTAVEHSMLNGEIVTETVDFYPDTSKPVRAYLDCTTARKQYCPTTYVDGNIVYLSCDNATAGVYTLTVTCTDTNGKARRYKSDACIEVYDLTSAAEIAGSFDEQTYEMNGVFYTFGATVQSDWDETNPESPAYIRNKPDLSDYATDEELQAVEEQIPNVPEWAMQPQKPSYTAGEVGAVPTSRTVNGKALSEDITLNAQDVGAQTPIADLAQIRRGAAKGATAYQLPSNGMPKTDLAVGVQQSLDKANTAYQKPSAGIPKTDLAQEIQQRLDIPIDDEPTAGSNNLVKSGGVANAFSELTSIIKLNKIYSASNKQPLITNIFIPAGTKIYVKVTSNDAVWSRFAIFGNSSTWPGEWYIDDIANGVEKSLVAPVNITNIYGFLISATTYGTLYINIRWANSLVVTEANIEANSITSSKIQDNAITSSKIQDNAIGTSKIADDSISTEKIKDNAITTPKISDNAVVTNKLANESVVFNKAGGMVKSAVKSVADNGIYKVEIDNLSTYVNFSSQFIMPIPVGTVIRNNGVKVALGSDSLLTDRVDLSNGGSWKSTFEINCVKTLEVAGNVRLILDNRETLFNGVTFGSSNIQDDAIGIKKLSITDCGVNIYDHDNDTGYEPGKYIRSSAGTLADGGDYNTSGYIPVKPSISYSYVNTAAAYRFVLQYNAQKQAITSTYQSGDITTFTTNENAAFVRVTFYKNKPFFMCEGNERKPYEAYREFISRDYLPTDADYNIYSDLFFLPKHIYVASGRTIEIYYSQIMLNADKYNMRATCNIGKALDRKFQIVGDNSHVGNTYELSISVYDDFENVVAYGTSTIHIVSNTISSAKNVLPVGDSLTNGKAWLTELHTLSANLDTVGTRSGKHEGRSGANVSTYTNVSGGIVYDFDNQYSGVGYGTAPTFDSTQSYSIGDKVKIAHTFGNGTTGYRYWVFTSAHAPGDFNESEAYCFSDGNPFYDYVNDKFSMSFYKTFQNINYDAIILFLGTHGINLTPETNPLGALGIKNLIELIREDEPTIPIVVVNTIFRSSQNGIGNQNNTDGYKAQNAYKFNEDKKVLLLGQAIEKMCGSMSNVYLCPVGFTHDSKYNFGNTKIEVNPRLTDTTTVYELQPSDSVHPQNSGYMQMADEIFSTLCAVFNT